MDKKDVIAFAALCAGLTGFAIGYAFKAAPAIPDGIYLNGKALDLRNMTLEEIRKALPNLRMPALPQPDRKKKDGALGDVVSSAPFPKPVAFQVIEQRGQPNKPVEAFGIETLVQVLKELKEAVFGNPKLGTPGLRDDIAKGLGDFYSTLRTGFVVFCGSVVALFGWIAVSLHRIADNSATRVMQMTAIQELAKAQGATNVR